MLYYLHSNAHNLIYSKLFEVRLFQLTKKLIKHAHDLSHSHSLLTPRLIIYFLKSHTHESNVAASLLKLSTKLNGIFSLFELLFVLKQNFKPHMIRQSTKEDKLCIVTFPLYRRLTPVRHCLATEFSSIAPRLTLCFVPRFSRENALFFRRLQYCLMLIKSGVLASLYTSFAFILCRLCKRKYLPLLLLLTTIQHWLYYNFPMRVRFINKISKISFSVFLLLYFCTQIKEPVNAEGPPATRKPFRCNNKRFIIKPHFVYTDAVLSCHFIRCSFKAINLN